MPETKTITKLGKRTKVVHTYWIDNEPEAKKRRQDLVTDIVQNMKTKIPKFYADVINSVRSAAEYNNVPVYTYRKPMQDMFDGMKHEIWKKLEEKEKRQ